MWSPAKSDRGLNFEEVVKIQNHQGELEWTYQRNLGILSSLKDQFEAGDHEFMVLICSAWPLSLIVLCCSDKYGQSRCMVKYIWSWGSAQRNVIKGIGELKVLANKKWYLM